MSTNITIAPPEAVALPKGRRWKATIAVRLPLLVAGGI